MEGTRLNTLYKLSIDHVPPTCTKQHVTSTALAITNICDADLTLWHMWMYNNSNKWVCTTTYKSSLFLPMVYCLMSARVVLWESNTKPHIIYFKPIERTIGQTWWNLTCGLMQIDVWAISTRRILLHIDQGRLHLLQICGDCQSQEWCSSFLSQSFTLCWKTNKKSCEDSQDRSRERVLWWWIWLTSWAWRYHAGNHHTLHSIIEWIHWRRQQNHMWSRSKYVTSS